MKAALRWFLLRLLCVFDIHLDTVFTYWMEGCDNCFPYTTGRELRSRSTCVTCGSWTEESNKGDMVRGRNLEHGWQFAPWWARPFLAILFVCSVIVHAIECRMRERRP